MRRRWADRIAGILVGVAIGLGVLVYFVFVHSEGTIDAPKIDESQAGVTHGGTTTDESGPPANGAEPSPGAGAPTGGEASPEGKGGSRPVPVVKVIGGAPPTGSGPKQLRFRVGEEVRFEIEPDEPFSFEIRGLGIEKSIESASIVSFPATRTGQFPVVASATLIGVADLVIEKRKTPAKAGG